MFEFRKEGQSIHDVWIEDGIAYSSNWADGVYLVDVGNGTAGGSPSNFVAFGNYAFMPAVHIMLLILLKVSLQVNFIQY